MIAGGEESDEEKDTGMVAVAPTPAAAHDATSYATPPSTPSTPNKQNKHTQPHPTTQAQQHTNANANAQQQTQVRPQKATTAGTDEPGGGAPLARPWDGHRTPAWQAQPAPRTPHTTPPPSPPHALHTTHTPAHTAAHTAPHTAVWARTDEAVESGAEGGGWTLAPGKTSESKARNRSDSQKQNHDMKEITQYVDP